MYKCSGCGASFLTKTGVCPGCKQRLWYDAPARTSTRPAKPGEVILGLIFLGALLVGGWYACGWLWGTTAEWYAGRQARSAAEKFLNLVGESRFPVACKLHVAPGPIQHPDELEALFRPLQFDGCQSVTWQEAALNAERTSCTLKGLARLKSGQEVPLTLRVVERPDTWRVQTVSSP